jgi:hypothetical protein
VPKINWVFRAFYGHFYQASPLQTATGPLLQFVSAQNVGFIPLHGGRDEESHFGVAMPYKGWILDVDTFGTRARIISIIIVSEIQIFSFPLRLMVR